MSHLSGPQHRSCSTARIEPSTFTQELYCPQERVKGRKEIKPHQGLNSLQKDDAQLPIEPPELPIHELTYKLDLRDLKRQNFIASVQVIHPERGSALFKS